MQLRMEVAQELYKGVLESYEKELGYMMFEQRAQEVRSSLLWATCIYDKVVVMNDVFKRAGMIGYHWVMSSFDYTSIGPLSLASLIAVFLECEGAELLSSYKWQYKLIEAITNKCSNTSWEDREEMLPHLFDDISRICSEHWICSKVNMQSKAQTKLCHCT